jgi:hypothetical protein
MADILSCGLLDVVLSFWAQSGQVSLPRLDGVDPSPGRYMYPPARRVNVSSIHHSKKQGSVVVDNPCRWLEKNLKGPERRVWAVAFFEDEIYAQFPTALNIVSPPIFRTRSIRNCRPTQSQLY